MVLGLRSKNRKGAAFHVDYIVHVQELRPWPPSQSLRSLRSVVLQWENGERNSGSGNPIVPSLTEGKLVFDESFKLQVTLLKEAPVRGHDPGTFQKNVLELNLYEPRRDKTVKGQHLGSALVDLAEHGVIKEAVDLAIPMNCKRSFRNTPVPVLFLKIKPFGKANPSSSSRECLSKELSLDKDVRDSVSALMNEEYAEEAEIASLTDDDISSSQSSLTHSTSTYESIVDSHEDEQPHNEDDSTLSLKQDANLGNLQDGNASSRSIELYDVPGKSEIHDGCATNSPQRSLMSVTLKPDTASTTSENTETESSCHESEYGVNCCKVKDLPSRDEDDLVEQSCTLSHMDSKHSIVSTLKNACVTAARTDLSTSIDDASLEINDNSIENNCSGHEDLLEMKRTQPECAAENVDKDNLVEIKCSNDNYVQAFNLEESMVVQQLMISSKDSENQNNSSIPDYEKLPQAIIGSFTDENLKTPSFMVESGLSENGNHFKKEVKVTDILEDEHRYSRTGHQRTGQNPDRYMYGDTESSPDHNIKELEHRMEMLEAELREAAAIEVSLYSILAEHRSSAQKVHAPARRLSRLYSHASKLSHERRASAARSAVSGLALVAKSCSNDVPRLTFWLSNVVVLRAIVSEATDVSFHISTGYQPESNGATGKTSSPLRWRPVTKRENIHFCVANDHDLGNPATFISALKRVEAWIFSRIIESVWWQILTPYMQSTNKNDKPKTNANMNKVYGRKLTASNQQQAIFSMDTWKKAFKDACERLCPVRAEGHDCGCLRLLPRLIMEQCVERLDKAMFNAILRESVDQFPTDPVSDPISDYNVLPVPAGKSSFGAGTQLKNAIGNWSRWLTDLFGIDDDIESAEHETGQDGDGNETASKSFHLLSALSDLFMLPKDMLLDESNRKEVCPTFSASTIKRILSSFEPDEFCPDPIPNAVFQALDSQDELEDREGVIRSIPCEASPIVYSPPSVVSVMSEIGDAQDRHPLRTSSALRKGHTSDDELEELDSPLALITTSKPAVETPKFKGGPEMIRYQLLREVWRGND